MITRIYSGGNLSAEQLLATTKADVDIWFPEVSLVNGRSVPLNHSEQVRMLPQLKYKTVGTLSEIIIVMFLREIRQCRMSVDELEVYCDGRRINLGINGGLIDPWDGGFFETGFNLRFN